MYGDSKSCLLYTSDAADERSSVDLGGRRIIKKKNNVKDYEKRGYKNQIEIKRKNVTTQRKTVRQKQEIER